MANIESNTLLEKLTQINSIKNRLRQSIINVGGGDYIDEQSPFSAFPPAISQIFADIHDVDRALDYTVNGGDIDDIVNNDKTSYNDLADYLVDLQVSKSHLVDNLRVKGVDADLSDDLEGLVTKVLDITGGDIPPGPDEYELLLNRLAYNENEEPIKFIAEFTGISNTDKAVIKYSFKNMTNRTFTGFIFQETLNDKIKIHSFSNLESYIPGKTISYTEEIDYEYYIETLRPLYRNPSITILQYDALEDCEYSSNDLDVSEFIGNGLYYRTRYYKSNYIPYQMVFRYFVDRNANVQYEKSLSAGQGITLSHLNFYNKTFDVLCSYHQYSRFLVYGYNQVINSNYEIKPSSYDCNTILPMVYTSDIEEHSWNNIYENYCTYFDLDSRYADITKYQIEKVIAPTNILTKISYDVDKNIEERYTDLKFHLEENTRNIKATYYYINTETKEVLEPKTEETWSKLSSFEEIKLTLPNQSGNYCLVVELVKTNLLPENIYLVDYDNFKYKDLISIDYTVTQDGDRIRYDLTFTKSKTIKDYLKIEYVNESVVDGSRTSYGDRMWLNYYDTLSMDIPALENTALILRFTITI